VSHAKSDNAGRPSARVFRGDRVGLRLRLTPTYDSSRAPGNES